MKLAKPTKIFSVSSLNLPATTVAKRAFACLRNITSLVLSNEFSPLKKMECVNNEGQLRNVSANLFLFIGIIIT